MVKHTINKQEIKEKIKNIFSNIQRGRRLKQERKSYLINYSVGWNLYKPNRNMKKVGVLGGLYGVSLIIPFTTLPLTIAFNQLTKYRPLYLFT